MEKYPFAYVVVVVLPLEAVVDTSWRMTPWFEEEFPLHIFVLSGSTVHCVALM